jgi:hypothetical protein
MARITKKQDHSHLIVIMKTQVSLVDLSTFGLYAGIRIYAS